MAKKRRKPNRPRPSSGSRPSSQPDRGETAQQTSRRPGQPAGQQRSDRTERKEMARHEREAARRRVARSRAMRRWTTIAVVMGAVGVGAFLIFRVAAPGDVSASAIEVARAAGCGDVQTPAGSAPGGQHLGAGESAGYTEFPASSGLHASAPLPADPAVHTQPVSEEAAVHNLEHGYIVLYYRADGAEALPEEVVGRLAQIANGQDKVLLAPHPQLDEGTSLAIVAWNKVWECPATVTAADAATMAESFIEAYKGSSNAPEGNVP